MHIEPGMAVAQLPTPVLVVDLDAMQHNIDTVARACQAAANGVLLRPHVKNHKSPYVAWRQIRAGGTVGGVCAAKVSEAEVFVQAGIEDVLIANQIVAPRKIARLAALARGACVTVAVDDVEQVRRLAHGARAAAVSIGVVIEIDTMMRRGGVRSTGHAVELAGQIVRTRGVAFRGVMSHQVPTADQPSVDERFREGGGYIDHVLAVVAALQAAGFTCEVVSTGESWTYDVAATIPGVTEIEGGSYVMMEVPYRYMTEFRPAAKVLGTVVALHDDHGALGDVPVEAIGAPNGPPSLEGMEGVRVRAIDHCGTWLESDAPMPLALGDRFVLLTHQQDVTVNRWERYVGVRGGVVETIVEAPARGCIN